MNEYEELLVLLARNDVRFITVGGFACAFNGYVRPTEDVDILVDNSPKNLSTLLHVLSNYNEGCAKELNVNDFTDEEGAFRIIEKFPIDIFVKMSGSYYKDFEKHIKYRSIENHSIPFLDRPQLIRLKENSLREQDKMDVLKLKSLP